MKDKLKYITVHLLIFIIIITTASDGTNFANASSVNTDTSKFIKKVSNSYTNKFCNSIAFGLSKESAMNFSIKENKQVFNKKKEMKLVNKDELAEEIANSVVEKCGYPINLLGEKGAQEFKVYYLSKDN